MLLSAKPESPTMLSLIVLAWAQSTPDVEELEPAHPPNQTLCDRHASNAGQSASQVTFPGLFKGKGVVEHDIDDAIWLRDLGVRGFENPDYHYCIIIPSRAGSDEQRGLRRAYVRQLLVQTGASPDNVLVVQREEIDPDVGVAAFYWIGTHDDSWNRDVAIAAESLPALTWVPGPTAGTSVRLRPQPDDADGDGVRGADDACPAHAEDFDGHLDLDGCPERGPTAYPGEVPVAVVAATSDEVPPWPSIDSPLRTAASHPEDAAVVVGLESYAFLPQVPFAARDADAFYDFFVHTSGIPSDRVQLLHEGSVEQLRPALQAAGNSVGPGGTVWIYFAGHGASDAGSDQQVLLGDDTRPSLESFASRSLGLAEVQQLASANGGSPFLILDACFSGTGRGGADLTNGQRFAVPSYALPQAPVGAVWSATSPGETSGPLPSTEHGAFTYLVVGALRGWADGEGGTPDGVVSAEEAQRWVERALRARQIRGQTPRWVGPLDGTLSIGNEPGLSLD
jgi:hypothetical protein